MRDLSTIAKLLAEEDIFVQNKNQSTASFDVKKSCTFTSYLERNV